MVKRQEFIQAFDDRVLSARANAGHRIHHNTRVRDIAGKLWERHTKIYRQFASLEDLMAAITKED